MKYWLLLLLFCGGCAHQGEVYYFAGPKGDLGLQIECEAKPQCLQRAGTVCKDGYQIIKLEEQPQLVQLSVECSSKEKYVNAAY